MVRDVEILVECGSLREVGTFEGKIERLVRFLATETQKGVNACRTTLQLIMRKAKVECTQELRMVGWLYSARLASKRGASCN